MKIRIALIAFLFAWTGICIWLDWSLWFSVPTFIFGLAAVFEDLFL